MSDLGACPWLDVSKRFMGSFKLLFDPNSKYGLFPNDVRGLASRVTVRILSPIASGLLLEAVSFSNVEFNYTKAGNSQFIN